MMSIQVAYTIYCDNDCDTPPFGALPHEIELGAALLQIHQPKFFAAMAVVARWKPDEPRHFAAQTSIGDSLKDAKWKCPACAKIVEER
jgi:hypothetical protein